MYRKLTAQRIFNGQNFLSTPGAIIATSAGRIEAVVPLEAAGDDVEYFDGILCPGFINAHCHIELSHMKAVIAEHTGLVNFVMQVIQRREKPATQDAELSPEEQFEKFLDTKHRAMTAAAEELYQGGTVAVADICNGTDSIELKRDAKLHWRNFIEVSGFVSSLAEKRYTAAEQVLLSFKERLNPAHSSITPHAPYSVSAALFSLLNKATPAQIISIHNQETEAENRLYQTGQGAFLQLYGQLGIAADDFMPTAKSSLQSWMPFFTGRQRCIAVHNTFTSEDDVRFASKHPEFFWCLCPNANLYIENRLPALNLFAGFNDRMLIGTDSYASNHRLDMLSEINTLLKHFPELPLENVLQWATYNGAIALNMQHELGTLAAGKRPGIVHIQADFSAAKRVG